MSNFLFNTIINDFDEETTITFHDEGADQRVVVGNVLCLEPNTFPQGRVLQKLSIHFTMDGKNEWIVLIPIHSGDVPGIRVQKSCQYADDLFEFVRDVKSGWTIIFGDYLQYWVDSRNNH